MSKTRYYLFRVGNDIYRLEKAAGPRSACKMAFGVIYDSRSTVRYKEVGSRSPRYWTIAMRESAYGSEGWLPVPDTGD